MKTSRNKLSARYLVSLRTHLHQAVDGNSARAAALGRAAVASGIATLDLATIHQDAVLALGESRDFAGLIRRAGGFFTQALGPLEADGRATRETNRRLRQSNETLRDHTAALARGNQRLQREVGRRQLAELKNKQAKERYHRLFLDSRLMQANLHRLTRQVLSAQEEERTKISRELHDEVVQALVGINVGLSALGTGADAGIPSLRRKIAETQRVVAKSVQAVHCFARGLRPAVLDDLGLIPALHAYSQNLAARKKLRIVITAFGGVEALGIAKRTVLFRVAQEALDNAACHGAASHVTLSLTEHAGSVRLEIGDNGKSFDVERTLRAKNNRHFGLIGMRERIEMIGGLLAIESSAGHGTVVRADIPFRLADKTK